MLLNSPATLAHKRRHYAKGLCGNLQLPQIYNSACYITLYWSCSVKSLLYVLLIALYTASALMLLFACSYLLLFRTAVSLQFEL